jgi:hypothetical protein
MSILKIDESSLLEAFGNIDIEFEITVKTARKWFRYADQECAIARINLEQASADNYDVLRHQFYIAQIKREIAHGLYLLYLGRDDEFDQRELLNAFGNIDLEFDRHTYIRYKRAAIAAKWAYDLAFNEWDKLLNEDAEYKLLIDATIKKQEAYETYTSLAALALYYFQRENEEDDDDEEEEWTPGALPEGSSAESIVDELERAAARAFAIAA